MSWILVVAYLDLALRLAGLGLLAAPLVDHEHLHLVREELVQALVGPQRGDGRVILADDVAVLEVL